jgi:hypothetical protein
MMNLVLSPTKKYFRISLDKRGYSASREEAMADFKAWWSRQTIAQAKIPSPRTIVG